MLAGEYHRGGGYETKREAREAENFLSPHRQMAFGELCDKYLTWIKIRGQSACWIYEKKLFIKNHLSKWFNMAMAEITLQMVENHCSQRFSSVSAYMANKDLKFIKAIFNFAIKNNWVEYNPCVNIQRFPEEEHIRYTPSIADFQRVRMIAKPIDQFYLDLIFYTAGRPGEVLALKWEDIYKDYLILRSRKHRDGTMRERQIPMLSAIKKILDQMRNGSDPNGYVFQNNRTGSRFLRRPKLIKSLCRRADVKSFGLHAIRHLAASVLSEGQMPIKPLSEYLGHSKISTTERYLHSMQDSFGYAQKLEEALSGNING
jgi:integrase